MVTGKLPPSFAQPTWRLSKCICVVLSKNLISLLDTQKELINTIWSALSNKREYIYVWYINIFHRFTYRYILWHMFYLFIYLHLSFHSSLHHLRIYISLYLENLLKVFQNSKSWIRSLVLAQFLIPATVMVYGSLKV